MRVLVESLIEFMEVFIEGHIKRMYSQHYREPCSLATLIPTPVERATRVLFCRTGGEGGNSLFGVWRTGSFCHPPSEHMPYVAAK